MSKVTDFQKKVYKLTQLIPCGKVATYGDLAEILETSPRAIGQALKKNPYAPRVPCHRVVSATGLGGYFGIIDNPAKKKLLKIEGAFDGDGNLRMISRSRLKKLYTL